MDPVEVDPEPDPTFEEKTDPDPTFEKKNESGSDLREKNPDPNPTFEKKNRIRSSRMNQWRKRPLKQKPDPDPNFLPNEFHLLLFSFNIKANIIDIFIKNVLWSINTSRKFNFSIQLKVYITFKTTKTMVKRQNPHRSTTTQYKNNANKYNKRKHNKRYEKKQTQDLCKLWQVIAGEATAALVPAATGPSGRSLQGLASRGEQS